MCCGSGKVGGTFAHGSLEGFPPVCCDDVFKCVWDSLDFKDLGAVFPLLAASCRGESALPVWPRRPAEFPAFEPRSAGGDRVK